MRTRETSVANSNWHLGRTLERKEVVDTAASVLVAAAEVFEGARVVDEKKGTVRVVRTLLDAFQEAFLEEGQRKLYLHGGDFRACAWEKKDLAAPVIGRGHQIVIPVEDSFVTSSWLEYNQQLKGGGGTPWLQLRGEMFLSERHRRRIALALEMTFAGSLVTRSHKGEISEEWLNAMREHSQEIRISGYIREGHPARTITALYTLRSFVVHRRKGEERITLL